jgi:hypothetical protein
MLRHKFAALFSAMLAAMLIRPPSLVGADSPLESEFKTPPTAARLQAYWFWVDSNFSQEGITKDLEAMKSAGFGAALILNVGSGRLANPPWPDQTYRSQAWFDAIKHAATEAQRLGMTIGLANAPGYTGTGGPWVPEEESMRRLVWTHKEVEGPRKLELALARPTLPGGGLAKAKKPSKVYDDIAVLAVPAGKTIALKQIVDLSARMQPDGRLAWDVPAGKWSIYRIGDMPTLKAPHPAPNGLTANLEVDKMDRKANLRHWRNVIESLKQALGPLYGTSFNRLHIDSYECGTQNWSKHFREEFIRRKGYDPVPWLVTFGTPVLGYKPRQFNGSMWNGMARNESSRIIESADQTARFEWDFVDVVNRLFTDNWLLAKSLMTPDHIQFSFEPYAGPFSIIEGAAIADVPMATFWTTTRCDYSLTNMDGDGTVAIETPAGARAAGRTVINSESYTSMPAVSMWTEKPALLKYIADGAFASGVNQMTLHHWTHQPFADQYQPGLTFNKWGLHFSRFQTWFEPGKAYFNYLTRCQALLQQGEEVVDSLAIDTPFNSQAEVEDSRTFENPVRKSEHVDLISSYDFIKDATGVVDGKVRLSSGRTYYYITYPATGVVLPEVAAKLQRLLAEGATVVTERFKQSPSLKDYPACDQAIAKVSAEIWDSGKYRGRLFADAEAARKKLALLPDYEIHSVRGADSVKVLHRCSAEADIYFVANRLEQPQNFTVEFRIQGKQPELWQAEDLSISDAPVWNELNGRTSVLVSLGGHQSVFVVFRRPAGSADHPVSLTVADEAAAQWSVGRDLSGKPVFRAANNVSAKAVYSTGEEKTVRTEPIAPVQIEGAWEVSFAPKLAAPFQLAFPELVDFSRHDDSRVKYFSGTATYRKVLRLEAVQLAAHRRILLDLGVMNDIATVRVNGSEAKVLWYAPYTMDVTGLVREGDNQLEIAVTDNWANALIGDEQIPADFETPPPAAVQKSSVGYDLPRFPDWFVKGQPRPSARKTFTTWSYYRKDSELKPAGLVGPVRVRFEQQVGL